MSQKFLDQS